MRKLCLIGLVSMGCASEPIGVDTLFGKENGLKSITTLALVGSSNYKYNLYPNIDAQSIGHQSKSIHLQQTILYTINQEFEVFTTAAGHFTKTEAQNESFASKNEWEFDALWIGASYSTPSILGFVPQWSMQTALIEQKELDKHNKTFSLHSYSADLRLQSYSDPVAYAIYIGARYNHKYNFGRQKLKNGDLLFAGLDVSVLLSPKISLDFELEQTYQAATRLNRQKISSSYLLPSLSIGATYSFTPNSAIIISGSASGSGAAPDSVFQVSLWKRF